MCTQGCTTYLPISKICEHMQYADRKHIFVLHEVLFNSEGLLCFPLLKRFS